MSAESSVMEVSVSPSHPLQERPETRVFQSVTMSAVRRLVSRWATDAGMNPSRCYDLVLAVCEVATNSVRHAQGWGVLRVWQDGHVLICEVADRGRPDRPLAGREPPAPGQEGGYGLWIASRLCDRVEFVSTATRTVVRLHMRLGES